MRYTLLRLELLLNTLNVLLLLRVILLLVISLVVILWFIVKVIILMLGCKVSIDVYAYIDIALLLWSIHTSIVHAIVIIISPNSNILISVIIYLTFNVRSRSSNTLNLSSFIFFALIFLLSLIFRVCFSRLNCIFTALFLLTLSITSFIIFVLIGT